MSRARPMSVAERRHHAARGSTWSVVEMIRSEAARLGLPVNFQTDLDHDQRAILDRAGMEHDAERAFGWAVHRDGSHFSWAVLGSTVKDPRTRADMPHRYFRMVSETIEPERQIHWYLYHPDTGLRACRDAGDLDEQLQEIAVAFYAGREVSL